jgi:hypothetical protein
MSDPRRSVSGMNLPKRLAGRRNRTGYPDQVEDAAGPDPGVMAHLNWVADTVGEYGWAVSGSRADGKVPPWAYSIGMWLTCQPQACQGSELILCGLPVESAASIINAVGARAADGMEITPDTVLDDICETPLAFRPVDLSWRKTRLLTISDAFYGMVRVPYLQVVWSDTDGRFPWERGFKRGFERMQPMLWLPHDDNPPSPWTRLDQQQAVLGVEGVDLGGEVLGEDGAPDA